MIGPLRRWLGRFRRPAAPVIAVTLDGEAVDVPLSSNGVLELAREPDSGFTVDLAEGAAHAYVLLRDTPDLRQPPVPARLPVRGDAWYEIRISLECTDPEAVVWIVEYDGEARLKSTRCARSPEGFALTLRTRAGASALAVGFQIFQRCRLELLAVEITHLPDGPARPAVRVRVDDGELELGLSSRARIEVRSPGRIAFVNPNVSGSSYVFFKPNPGAMTPPEEASIPLQPGDWYRLTVRWQCSDPDAELWVFEFGGGERKRYFKTGATGEQMQVLWQVDAQATTLCPAFRFTADCDFSVESASVEWLASGTARHLLECELDGRPVELPIEGNSLVTASDDDPRAFRLSAPHGVTRPIAQIGEGQSTASLPEHAFFALSPDTWYRIELEVDSDDPEMEGLSLEYNDAELVQLTHLVPTPTGFAKVWLPRPGTTRLKLAVRLAGDGELRLGRVEVEAVSATTRIAASLAGEARELTLASASAAVRTAREEAETIEIRPASVAERAHVYLVDRDDASSPELDARRPVAPLTCYRLRLEAGIDGPGVELHAIEFAGERRLDVHARRLGAAGGEVALRTGPETDAVSIRLTTARNATLAGATVTLARPRGDDPLALIDALARADDGESALETGIGKLAAGSGEAAAVEEAAYVYLRNHRPWQARGHGESALGQSGSAALAEDLSRFYRREGFFRRSLELIEPHAHTGDGAYAHRLTLLRAKATLLADGYPAGPAGEAPREVPDRHGLYLLHSSLPHWTSGYTTRTHALLRCLRARGIEIDAVTRPGFPRNMRELDLEAAEDVDVVDEISYFRTSGRFLSYRDQSALDHLDDYCDAVAALAAERRPAVLHAASNYINGLVANRVARRLGRPSIYEVRGLWELTVSARNPLWPESDEYALSVRMETEAALGASAVVTLNDALRDEMIARGVAPERIVVVPNGVAPERFEARPPDADLAARLGVAGRTVIGYVGSVLHYEGLDYLLRAAAILAGNGREDFAVLIVGGGDALEGLERLRDELGLGATVVLAGRVEHAEVERYYSVMDVTAYPRKGLALCEMVSPMKPLEAMAMGKAVVASDVAAIRGMIDDERTGLLHRKDDPEDLARALARLLDDADLRARLGRASRHMVETERDWNTLAGRLADLYESLAGSAPSSRTPRP